MSQSGKTKLIDLLYIFLTIMIILMVAKGYGDMYLLSVAQQVALQEYEESLALLKTKVKELEKASFELLDKVDGKTIMTKSPDNGQITAVLKPETSSSSGMDNIDIVDPNVMQGVLFFVLTMTVVYLLQDQHIKNRAKDLLSFTSFADTALSRNYLTSMFSEQKLLIKSHLNDIIARLNSVRTALLGYSGANTILDGPLYQSFQERLEALTAFSDMLEQPDFFADIQANLGPLMMETRELLNRVIQHLVVLDDRTQQVEQMVALMQAAEIHLAIATAVVGQ